MLSLSPPGEEKQFKSAHVFQCVAKRREMHTIIVVHLVIVLLDVLQSGWNHRRRDACGNVCRAILLTMRG